MLWVGILLIDFIVYLIISLTLLNYEDYYDESECKYWSLAGMMTIDKIAFMGYYLLIAANMILVSSAVFKIAVKCIIKNGFLSTQ